MVEKDRRGSPSMLFFQRGSKKANDVNLICTSYWKTFSFNTFTEAQQTEGSAQCEVSLALRHGVRKLQIFVCLDLLDSGFGSQHLDCRSFEQLKADVLRFLPKDVADKLGALPLKSPPPRQQKIDHVVVLYMENHAADAFFGCMNLPGFDGIKGHSIPKDPTDWSKGQINITCGKALYVCEKGPSYDTFAPKFAKDGNPNHYPYSEQKDNFSAFNGASENGTAVTMFGPEQIPIKAALAKQFGVFNRLFTATPTASSPNHLFTQSATSCGMTSNVLYPDCGGNGTYFPQPTIYDSLRLHNVSFSLFMNSTCGLDGKPCHGEDPHDPEAGSAISSPDVAMIGVARHKDRFMSQQIFYEQAANGTLPALSWILPPLQACDHPCHDIAKGERILERCLWGYSCWALMEPHSIFPCLWWCWGLLWPCYPSTWRCPGRWVLLYHPRQASKVRSSVWFQKVGFANNIDAYFTLGRQRGSFPRASAWPLQHFTIWIDFASCYCQKSLQFIVFSHKPRCLGREFWGTTAWNASHRCTAASARCTSSGNTLEPTSTEITREWRTSSPTLQFLARGKWSQV